MEPAALILVFPRIHLAILPTTVEWLKSTEKGSCRKKPAVLMAAPQPVAGDGMPQASGQTKILLAAFPVSAVG
jgi:hypothetical protein